jgi:imidazole glycerol-phosphate synthase subunit HisH
VKVSIVDYGAGNLPSVERALAALGAETERVTTPEALRSAAAIVLPGVGHFSAFVSGLRERELTEALLEAVGAETPVLGICLGMQALYGASEEAAGAEGLGLIDANVRALPRDVKSPHIGWNQVRRVRESRLLRGIPEDAYFYFAHSYAAPVTERETAAVCDHGFPFAAVVECGRLMGVQFHPEKSGAPGAQVLGNFLEAAR